MKKKAWKARIKKACREAGTYKPYFDHVIDAMAGILEKRDQAWDEYEESEDGLIITQTNNKGSENKVKNPLISLWDDLNKSALAYWKELGLTPAGLKKMNEEVFVKKEEEKGNSLMRKLQQVREQ